MSNDKKVEAATEAIRKVCSDTSVSVEDTIDALQSLKDHIEVMLESLKD